MNVRATRRTVVGLASGVVVGLTLHVFMLAGMSLAHQPAGSGMGSTTDHAGQTFVASPPEPAPHAAAGHVMLGCFAVLTALGVLFRLFRAAAAAARTPSRHATSRLEPCRLRVARELPPPARPLVAAGVLLRV